MGGRRWRLYQDPGNLLGTMARNTSFVLSEELDGFIREQVSAGEYGSASEVVRDALERLADEKRKEAALLAALDQGVKSGQAEPGVFARLRKRHAAR